MKRIFSLIIIATLLLTFSACKDKKGEEATPAPPVSEPQGEAPPKFEKDDQMIDYKEEAEPMTVEKAKEYLSKEDADPKTAEYRQAVSAVNSAAAQDAIDNAQAAQEITEEVKELFEGVAFRFIEGDQFGSPAVQSYLIKLGIYELKEDGYYHFTFHDRTLAQTSVNLEKTTHAYDAYSEVLDLLLSDPNIEVKVHQ